jgi:hypothetical protein
MDEIISLPTENLSLKIFYYFEEEKNILIIKSHLDLQNCELNFLHRM